MQGLIQNITALYPDAAVWLTGHSLGGALASLLGTTFGLPAVAFEAPGERIAAQRLHLPLPSLPPNRTEGDEGEGGGGGGGGEGSGGMGPHGHAHGYAAAPVTHVYHNADPIPQGTCTGAGSVCAQAGYALETRCHLGKSIVYDTVGKLGWKVDIRKHVIKEVITHVIEAEVEGWEDEEGALREVPEARAEEDCVVRREFLCPWFGRG